jgi:ubiquinone/menaquinone biosynthesis C-methylase UbiE
MRPGGSVLTEKALEICNLPTDSLVADIGCGGGGTLECLIQAGLSQTIGLDYSEALLGEVASSMSRVRLIRGSAEMLPFKEGSFDALFCECVVSILADRLGVLCEFERVLKKGGHLIVSDVFNQDDPHRGETAIASQGLLPDGVLTKKFLLSVLNGLGFSLLLWEEHERFLREFVARMILAGQCLPEPWRNKQGIKGKTTDRPRISYFLLVARKRGTVFQSADKRESTSWTT